MGIKRRKEEEKDEDMKEEEIKEVRKRVKKTKESKCSNDPHSTYSYNFLSVHNQPWQTVGHFLPL